MLNLGSPVRSTVKLLGCVLWAVVAACSSDWQSPARTDSANPWRSNPHELTIAVQELQRVPQPPYSKVVLTEGERNVRPLGPVTTQNCAGAQLLGLRTEIQSGLTDQQRREVAVWEYEVRRAGGNRLAYLQRLRDRTAFPNDEELHTELATCGDKLRAHYADAGAPLTSWDDHPIARAMIAESADE